MMCINGHSMQAFFPFGFMDKINGNYVENSMFPMLERLTNVNNVIAVVLRLLAEIKVRGIHCTSKEQKYVRLHVVLELYSADIPEHKDMLRVKYSTSTLKQVPRCHALVEHLKYSTAAKQQIVEETRNAIRKHHHMTSTAVSYGI